MRLTASCICNRSSARDRSEIIEASTNAVIVIVPINVVTAERFIRVGPRERAGTFARAPQRNDGHDQRKSNRPALVKIEKRPTAAGNGQIFQRIIFCAKGMAAQENDASDESDEQK
jgi:hypothetical protein